MKIGLIGFGSVGNRHYNNLLKHTKDIVVFSQRKNLDINGCVSKWDIFVEKGPYDAVFITNETYKHIKTIKQCINLKPRAIFVEKPLSHNLNDLSVIRSIIKKEKISFYVGYNFHFFKPYIYIKEIIDSGKLGKIYYLRASVGQNLKDWRQRDYKLNYSSKKKQGGGVLLDLVHDINYPSWLLGEKLILQSAIVRKLSDLDIDTEDCADSLFSTKSGVVVSVHQDYLRASLRTSLEIIGSKKSLLWDSVNQAVVLQEKEKEAKKKFFTERNDMFIAELKFFFTELKRNKFFTNIDEAIYDMEIINNIKKYGRK